jgi:hypothetical protein
MELSEYQQELRELSERTGTVEQLVEELTTLMKGDLISENDRIITLCTFITYHPQSSPEAQDTAEWARAAAIAHHRMNDLLKRVPEVTIELAQHPETLYQLYQVSLHEYRRKLEGDDEGGDPYSLS